MTKNGRSLLSIVLLSGASVLVGGGPGFGQGLDTGGICFTEQGRQNSRCACLDETGAFDPDRRYGQDNARLCANLNDNERAELTEPEITGSITPPDEVIDPTDPPGVVTPPEPPGPVDRPPTSAQEDNGIGNGIDPAPGRSDVTNGEVADGADSGGPNPEGSFTDGTAANGRPAGETNNPNADSTGTDTAAADRGNSENAPGQSND